MNTARLGEVAAFIRGVTFKPSDVMDSPAESSVGVMRTKNVQMELDTSDVLQIPRSLVRREEQYLRTGDVLISSANSWNLVGRCSWVPELGTPAAIGGFVTALRVASDRLEPRYLYRWFSSPNTQAEVRNSANQTTNIANLNLKRCEALRIPLPTLAEQRRITEILDRADTLRSARRQTIGLAEECGRAIFLEMFGQFAGEYVAVEDVALPEQGSIRTGPFGSQLLHSEFVSQGISVLGLDNVVGNSFRWGERRFITLEKYDTLKRYTVRPGDVLVSIMGTCGRCVVVPPDVGAAINTKHICAITLNQSVALPEFVRASFLWHPKSRRYLTQQTKGAIMDGLNMGIIKQMPLPLPSLEVQQQFVTRLREIDGFANRLRESSEQLGELFAALQSRAFSGQL